MSKKSETKDIFSETTTEIIDLESGSSDTDEIQVLTEGPEKEVEIVGEIAAEIEEVGQRIRHNPSPVTRYIKNSDFNPQIHLARGDIAVVKLDRSEIRNYEKNRESSPEKCQKMAEKDTSKKKGKYPKDIRKIIKKSSLDRAERSLAPPLATLHPDAPTTSTPKRIGMEEMKIGLRSCTQHCQSFYDRNGQPSLDRGTYPDHLSFKEARKEYRRNYQLAADRFPSLLEELERPSVYDTDPEQEAEEAPKEDEDEVEIPTVDDLLENPIPTTSGGTIGVVFPMDKFGSLITHGKILFQGGSEIDAAMEEALEKLARKTAIKHALDNSNIGARPALIARQGILEKIETYKERIKYLTGKRRRLIQILLTQQEQAEEAINRGIEPTLAQLGLTIDEVQTEFNELESADFGAPDESENDEHGNVPVPEPEMPDLEEALVEALQEAEVEDDVVSHISSNLSEPGLCSPDNPCSGSAPCTHHCGIY